MADKLKVSDNDIKTGAKIMLVIIALWVIYKLGGKIIDIFTGGEKQKENNAKLEKAKSTESSPWSGKVYTDTYTTPQTVYKKSAFINDMADKIHGAFSFFHLSNGYDIVLEQIKQLSNKAQFAQLVTAFQKKYNQDLASWLQEQSHYWGDSIFGGISGENDGLKSILDFVAQLPK